MNTHPWRFVRLVLCVLFVSAGIAGETPEPKAPVPRPVITVAIADFQNRHPLLDQEWISTALPELISSALANAARDGDHDVVVVDRTASAALDQEQRIAGEGTAAKGVIASHVLGGSFSVTDNQLQLDVAIAPIGQAATWTQRLTGPPEQLATLARRAAAGALASLGASGGSSTKGSAATELPLAALVTFHRGREAQRRGDHAWALADLLRTCKLAPQFGEAWLSLGVSLEALGRPHAALRAWEQAIACDPDDPGMAAALFRLARARESQPVLARRLYQRLMDDYPFTPAPAEIAGHMKRNYGEIITFAEVAAQRSADLIDEPIAQPSGGIPAADAPVAIAASAGSSLVESRMRQWRRLLDLRAKDENRDQADLTYLQLALMNAAGGWPEGVPCIRLLDGKSVMVPLTYQAVQTVAIGPPPGQVIDTLKGVVVPRSPHPSEQFRFEVNGIGFPDINNSRTSVLKSKDGQVATATVTPWQASGFLATAWLSLQARTAPGSPRPLADLTLTATLRPARPGTAWVTTQPPGALISIEGQPRGISPCRIIDLPPGPLKFQADTYLGHNSDGDEEPVNKYLRFTGEATVTVAGAGETRIDWTLGHTPERVSARWSSLRLAVPALLNAEIPRVTAPERHNQRLSMPVVIRHPRAGWLMGWSEDRDVRLANSADGKIWTPVRNITVNSGAEEFLEALEVSPQGQVLLVFRRDKDVLTTTSGDLTTWSAAIRLAEGNPDSGEVPVLGALATNDGQWVVAYKNNYGQIFLARSASASGWTMTATRSITQQEGWWISDKPILVQTAQGAPALLSLATASKRRNVARLVRAVLNQENQWVEVDQSSEFPQDRAFDQVNRWLRVGTQSYEIFSRKGLAVRWTVGSEVELFDGPRVNGLTVGASTDEAGLLVLQRSGSWWVMDRQGTQSPVPAQSPLVTYEKPESIRATATATSAAAPSAAALTAVPVAPTPAGDKPSDTVTSAVPPAPVVVDTATGRPLVGNAASTNDTAGPVKRGRSTLTVVLVLAAVFVLTAGISWWWWGFLRRRAEQQS